MAGPLTFALLIMVAVLAVFMAIWQLVRGRDRSADRLAEYGQTAGFTVATGEDTPWSATQARKKRLGRGIANSGIGGNIAIRLSSAGISLTAVEYVMIMFAAGFVGLIFGTLLNGLLVGFVVGAIFFAIPAVFVRMRLSKRRRNLTEQLPNVLTLLVSALRAGYGLTQALEMVVQQIDQPSSEEFGRVVRSVALGVPVQQALAEMAERVQTDDIDLVVTAITVQYEMGGNLAESLENIGATITDRIQMKREISALTSQQRLTGYLLACLPIGVLVLLFVISPDYVSGFISDPLLIAIGIFALLMQGMGFLIIRKIVDIEV